MPEPHQTFRRPPRSRLTRFVSTGLTLARVFIGYKLITFMERWRGSKWAEARRLRHHAWSARQIHETAVRGQGLLIKTCQFLSSRPDVVPDEYIQVLSTLQDEVPPEPFEVVRRLVERELGRS